MLRITIADTAMEERWILQGRLVVPWVNETEDELEKDAQDSSGAKVHREP